MKRLRELREGGGYTQEDLAKMLGVSQQTIARWENAKSEPNLAALRDIAMIFGTSVDDLLDMESAKITTNHYYIFGAENSDGFWGHVGLLLMGEQKTRWYPITLAESERIRTVLFERGSSDSSWLAASTLNNRMLVFPLNAIKRAWLLDDAADQPSDEDWDLPWDGYQGLPAEIYNAIEERIYFGDGVEYQCDFSEKLREIVEEFVANNNITQENISELITGTHVHFSDNTKDCYEVEPEQLSNLVFCAETEMPSVIRLNYLGDEFESYYPVTSISLIDMPLQQFIKGHKRELGELDV